MNNKNFRTADLRKIKKIKIKFNSQDIPYTFVRFSFNSILLKTTVFTCTNIMFLRFWYFALNKYLYFQQRRKTTILFCFLSTEEELDANR